MEPIAVNTLLVAIIHFSWNSLLPETSLVSNKYHNHSPPLIGSDVIVLIQSFLL